MAEDLPRDFYEVELFIGKSVIASFPAGTKNTVVENSITKAFGDDVHSWSLVESNTTYFQFVSNPDVTMVLKK